MLESFDLAIRGGEVVEPGGRRRADVLVRDGRIAAVTAEHRDATESVDAGGLLVMPGMVDAHVHFMDPGDPDREDFPTASAAAARAGVTTVVEHTHVAPVIGADDLEAKRRHLADRSVVDFALAAHAWPDRIDDVAPVWAAGACFIKAFTCTTHGVPGHGPAELNALLRAVAACDAVCLVHAEESTLLDRAEHDLRAAGREDGGVVPEWRNREAELTALAVTATLARETGARTIAAHVSQPGALAILARERAAGSPLTVESCPQYLSLLEREVLEHGAFRKFTPPARARKPEDLDAMWASAGGRRDRLHVERPRARHGGPEARRLDLGRALRAARDRHDLLRPARRRPRRADHLRAPRRGLRRGAGAGLRAGRQGQPAAGCRRRHRARRSARALDGARRRRRLEGGLVAVRRPHAHRPRRAHVPARRPSWPRTAASSEIPAAGASCPARAPRADRRTPRTFQRVTARSMGKTCSSATRSDTPANVFAGVWPEEERARLPASPSSGLALRARPCVTHAGHRSADRP